MNLWRSGETMILHLLLVWCSSCMGVGVAQVIYIGTFILLIKKQNFLIYRVHRQEHMVMYKYNTARQEWDIIRRWEDPWFLLQPVQLNRPALWRHTALMTTPLHFSTERNFTFKQASATQLSQSEASFIVLVSMHSCEQWGQDGK